MIRLATAHAKCRMSKTVDPEDSEVAIDLVQFAIFKEVRIITLPLNRRIQSFLFHRSSIKTNVRRMQTKHQHMTTMKRKLMKKIKKMMRHRWRRTLLHHHQHRNDGRDCFSSYSDNFLVFFSRQSSDEAAPREESSATKRQRRPARKVAGAATEDSTPAPASQIIISSARLDVFKGHLSTFIDRQPSVTTQEIFDYMKQHDSTFNEDEIRMALAKMQDENQIMLAGEIVIRI